MLKPVSEYFCCDDFADLKLSGELSLDPGYFQLGPEIVAYGRTSVGTRAKSASQPLYDAFSGVTRNGSGLGLPFDAAEVADNLRYEKYAAGTRQADARATARMVQAVYYLLRPFLPLAVRKHLQKIHLRDWQNIPFPHWPVDRTVDFLMEKLLVLAARKQGLNRIPFIWFWPDGASGCAIMTHDVEAEPGRAFCSELMSINEQFGIPASFQIVPEKRYEVSSAFLNEIRARGFEVNVQDLDHDGRLFRNYEEFVLRAAKINRYAQEYGAKGFRSAILYRNQDWFNRLQFSYDMSVPNVAHLDPQRGGCCTVMPYFIGNMLELPVTASQDHTLFNVLNDYSMSLWRQQSELILEKHGLIGFIVHPDYIISPRPRAAYKHLLEFITTLRADRGVWVALPGEVDRWWRQRAQMKIVRRQGVPVIEGPGNERARLGYACVEGERVVYELADSTLRVSANT